jgi:hypothetical protein
VSHQVAQYSHELGALGYLGCVSVRGYQGLVADITRKLDQVVREKSVRSEHELGRS